MADAALECLGRSFRVVGERGGQTTDLAISEMLHRRASACMPAGITRSTFYTKPRSPYAVAGNGIELHDADGHRLIDLHGNFSALVHGNAHPVVTRAAIAALEHGASFGLPTAADVALADHLQARQPSLQQPRFTTSGSEAAMMAIRAARAWSGKDRILRFAGCYHGCYDAVAGDQAPGRPASLRSEIVTVPVGDAARFLEGIPTGPHSGGASIAPASSSHRTDC